MGIPSLQAQVYPPTQQGERYVNGTWQHRRDSLNLGGWGTIVEGEAGPA